MEQKSLTLSELRQLTRRMRPGGVCSLELTGKHWRVRVQYPAALPSQTFAQAESHCVAEPTPVTPVIAPMPGHLLLRHPLLDTPFAQPGQTVKARDVLALIRVSGFYLPVICPLDGTLVSFSASDGEVIEYGQEIMCVRAAESAATGL